MNSVWYLERRDRQKAESYTPDNVPTLQGLCFPKPDNSPATNMIYALEFKEELRTLMEGQDVIEIGP